MTNGAGMATGFVRNVILSLLIRPYFSQACRITRLDARCKLRLFVAAASSAVLALIASAGCQAGAGTAVMRILAENQPRQEDPPSSAGTSAVEVSATSVDLAGAVNETLSFQFELRCGAFPIGDPRLEILSPSWAEASIDPSSFQIFRMHQVRVDAWPGWHVRAIPAEARDPNPWDVLVPIRAPRGGLPEALRPNRRYMFWVDVLIPKGTAEGRYASQIALLSDERRLAAIDVHLTVWPFALPDDPDFHAIAEVDHGALFAHHIQQRGRPYRLGVDAWREDPLRNEMNGLLQSTLRRLRQHGLTPVLPKLAPIIKVDAHDRVSVDWSQYDEIVAPFLDGGGFGDAVPLQHWPIPVERLLQGHSGSSTTPTAGEELLRSFLRQCASHFDENGWLARSYVALPELHPYDSETTRKASELAALVRSADERLSVLMPFFPQDMRPYGWVDFVPLRFDESVDIWMPRAQFFDPETMRAERSKGRRTWLRADRPPFGGSTTIHARACDVRALAWQAVAAGAGALHLGVVNPWPPADENPDPTDCTHFEPSVLLYPGGPFGLTEPVDSVRLKLIRRSLQDAAYTSLLERHGLGYITSTLQQSIVPYGGTEAYRTHFADGRLIPWPDDLNIFDAARHIMAEELTGKTKGREPGTRQDAFARTAAWRRFVLDTRSVDVHVVGARVMITGTAAAPAAEIRFAVMLSSQKRLPVSGQLHFPSLPEKWRLASDSVTEIEIPRSGSIRVSPVLYAQNMPMEQGGFLEVPLEFNAEDATHRAAARVAFVTAMPRGEPIRIDGKLSDWPPGTTNIAQDFVPIAGVPAATLSDGRVAPRNATSAFVMRDEEYLYLALNCELEPHGTLPPARQKRVHYEDMIPVGEELVEILLDPSNAGTRSPADLYHIVIKQTGADLTEKGLRYDPPCGRHEAWPADIDVATRTAGQRWTAELRIPWRAFDDVETEQTVWGFNITRFDASAQQFSTWSGARLNAYDPLALGNLYLP